jgi:hypothetical protein
MQGFLVVRGVGVGCMIREEIRFLLIPAYLLFYRGGVE